LESELKHVHQVLIKNGYDMNDAKRKRKKRDRHPEVNRIPLFLPFLKGVTDKIGCLMSKYSIKTIYTPPSKVSNILRTPKDIIPYQTPGIYKIDCSCGKAYIGQTKRTIAERVKEHISAVKNRQTNKSAIAEHLLNAGSSHWIELHKPQVLSTESHYYSRVFREAIEIKKYPNFNRDDGFSLPAAWNPIIPKMRKICSPKNNVDTVSIVCLGNQVVGKNMTSESDSDD
ncbi:GIY-YIG nuclease family protein, partial [Escherichia coli]